MNQDATIAAPSAAAQPAHVLVSRAACSRERVLELECLLGRDACRRLGIFAIPADFVLSVVIPVFNEAGTIEALVERVRATGLNVQIIIVDDGSSDGTRQVLERMRAQPDVEIVLHTRNQGKGAAIRTGFQHATGAVVIIQDADLEYNPDDYRPLIQPIVEGLADVVYGSRFNGPSRQVPPLWHLAANKLITWCFNLRHGRRFTDVETCYKAIRRELVEQVAPHLRESRFGIELELTARLLRLSRDVRFVERPIQYVRRSYAEGKKIGWRDGIAALWCILKY